MQGYSLTRSTRALLLVCLLAGATPSLAPLRAQNGNGATAVRTAETPRDAWQRAPDIFAALQAREGSRIADVGAGHGWLTTRLAKHVGPSGRVFAVDVSESALRDLQRNVAAEELTNVEAILGEEDDPRLPYASLDGIVVLNAYHEMTQRVAMLLAFKRALKPGGLLVIVDNNPSDSTATRQQQTSAHRLWIGHAEDDLVASGFEVVRRDPGFIGGSPSGMSHGQWLLVARRGAK